MSLRRPTKVAQWSIVGFLLALPTVLLVTGALLLGFGLGDSPIAQSSANVMRTNVLEQGTENQYLEPSLIKSAPSNWVEQKNAFGSPVLVSIRALELHSSVIPVTAYSGVMEIPEDISNVGWFVGSASPGQKEGSAVLVGHRTGSEGERGAFSAIHSLKNGDFILVTTSEGIRLKYQVIEVEAIDLDSLPTVANFVFDRQGEPRLTLITCGGDYESATGASKENVIVTAVPI